MKLSNSDVALALIAIACGGFTLLVASGVLPAQSAGNTPIWVVAVAGLVFVIGGVMILLRHHSRALDLFAAVILAGFTSIGVWVAFYSPADGISGGIPFLPESMNVGLGRIMFGLGALICFGCFLYALKRFFGSHK